MKYYRECLADVIADLVFRGRKSVNLRTNQRAGRLSAAVTDELCADGRVAPGLSDIRIAVVTAKLSADGRDNDGYRLSVEMLSQANCARTAGNRRVMIRPHGLLSQANCARTAGNGGSLESSRSLLSRANCAQTAGQFKKWGKGGGGRCCHIQIVRRRQVKGRIET